VRCRLDAGVQCYPSTDLSLFWIGRTDTLRRFMTLRYVRCTRIVCWSKRSGYFEQHNCSRQKERSSLSFTNASLSSSSTSYDITASSYSVSICRKGRRSSSLVYAKRRKAGRDRIAAVGRVLKSLLVLEARGGSGAGRVEAGRGRRALDSGLDVSDGGSDDVDVENLGTSGSGEHD